MLLAARIRAVPAEKSWGVLSTRGSSASFSDLQIGSSITHQPRFVTIKASSEIVP